MCVYVCVCVVFTATFAVTDNGREDNAGTETRRQEEPNKSVAGDKRVTEEV